MEGPDLLKLLETILKANPLTASDENYQQVVGIIRKSKATSVGQVGPALWSWLVALQSADASKPKESVMQALIEAEKYLCKHQSRLSVKSDVIAKLFFNILTKFLDVSESKACLPLLEIVDGISFGFSPMIFMNIEVCRMRILGFIRAKEFFNNWVQFRIEDEAKSDHFISLLVSHWKRNYIECDDTVELWKHIYRDEAFFLQFVADKMGPCLSCASREHIEKVLRLQPASSRYVLRLLSYCKGDFFPRLQLEGPQCPAFETVMSLNSHLEDGIPLGAGRSYDCKLSSTEYGELLIWLERTYLKLRQRGLEVSKMMLHSILKVLKLLEENRNHEDIFIRADFPEVSKTSLTFELISLKYLKLAYDSGNYLECHAYASLYREYHKEALKVIFNIVGALIKQEKYGEAAGFIKVLTSLDAVSLQQMKSLLSMYFKAGLHGLCFSLVSSFISGKMVSESEKASLIECFCSLPFEGDYLWRETGVALDFILKHINTPGKYTHPAILESFKNQYGNSTIVQDRHKYFLRKYTEAEFDRLLDEAKRFELDSLFIEAWSFAAGKDFDFENDSIRELNNEEHEMLLVRTTPIHLRMQEIRNVNSELQAADSHMKNLPITERGFIKDSFHIMRMVSSLVKLSRLYRLMGVWKPTRAYLQQALDLYKQQWPNRVAGQMLESELRGLDILTVGSSDVISSFSAPLPVSIFEEDVLEMIRQDPSMLWRPIAYTGISSTGLSNAFEVYMYGSAYLFSLVVFWTIRKQACSTDEALGLLALASALPYKFRDQVERKLESSIEEVTEENWRAFVLSQIPNDPVQPILLTFDFDDSNIFLANYQTRRLLLIPAKNFPEVKQRIDDTLAENKRVLFNKESDSESAEYKRTWWKARQKLDSDLSKLAQQIDTDWLFLFKSLFITTDSGDDGKVERMQAAVKKAFGSCFKEEAQTFLSFGPTPKASQLETLLPVISGVYENKAKAIKDLRRCFERAFTDDSVFTDETPCLVPDEILLIVDKHLHLFPWEVTPSLKACRVYRQPSFWHLSRSNARVSADSVSYILNPGGDLKRTESFFTERLDSSWRGIVGRPPQEQEFLSSLSNNNLFLYFGHGGGDAYVSGNKIRKLSQTSDQVASSFLIGCSSGKLKTLGPFCPEGTFLNYLYAGAPTILVNLWDVTDKDIDKFTDCMFDQLGLYSNESDENQDLAMAVNQSRNVCFLRHLNGAAPVIYGLPYKWHGKLDY